LLGDVRSDGAGGPISTVRATEFSFPVSF
jgi:hypothetical protein